jgi:hypothetical protein
VKLWLDNNLQLDLSRAAIEALEVAIRFSLGYETATPSPHIDAELETAANIIRAHLQHVDDNLDLIT